MICNKSHSKLIKLRNNSKCLVDNSLQTNDFNNRFSQLLNNLLITLDICNRDGCCMSCIMELSDTVINMKKIDFCYSDDYNRLINFLEREVYDLYCSL